MTELADKNTKLPTTYTPVGSNHYAFQISDHEKMTQFVLYDPLNWNRVYPGSNNLDLEMFQSLNQGQRV